MVNYKNGEDKKLREYLDKILFCNNITRYRKEKEDFFRTHRFVLGMLPEREADIISRYFLSDNLYNTGTIAEYYNLSRSRISNLLMQAIERLKRPIYYESICSFTDSDIGCTADNYQEFTLSRMQELLDEKKRIDSHLESERKRFLSEEDRSAESCFEAILNKRVSILNLNKPVPDLKMREILTKTAVVNNKNLSSLANEIHKLGLVFLSEAEHEEACKKRCVDGIKNHGVEELMRKFKISTVGSDKLSQKLNMSVDDLGFSYRCETIFDKFKIDTVEDIIRYSESELDSLKSLGVKSKNEIISVLNSLDLALCPEELSGDAWIGSLIEEAQGGRKAGNRESQFNEIMRLPLRSLNLSARAYNVLSRNGVRDLQGVVSISRQELEKFRNIGVTTIFEILEAVGKYGFDLRKDYLSKSAWIEELKNGYLGVVTKKNKNEIDRFVPNKFMMNTDLDINEIPEKYRYIYAKGAGLFAQETIENATTYDTMISRAMLKSSYKQSLKAMEYEPEYPTENSVDINYETLKAVRDDLKLIFDLNPIFIYKHYTAIKMFVLESENLLEVTKQRYIGYMDSKIESLFNPQGSM